MEKINKNKLLKKTALIRRYTHAYTDTGTYTLVNSPQAKEEISHQDASKRRKKNTLEPKRDASFSTMLCGNHSVLPAYKV